LKFDCRGESVVKIPLRLNSDLGVIRTAHKEYEATRTSPLTSFLSYLFMIYGAFPNYFSKILINSTPITCLVSSFPGGEANSLLHTKEGKKIKCTEGAFTMGTALPTIGNLVSLIHPCEVSFLTTISICCTGIGFTLLSYGSSVAVSVILNKSLYSREEAERFSNEFTNGINAYFEHFI